MLNAHLLYCAYVYFYLAADFWYGLLFCTCLHFLPKMITISGSELRNHNTHVLLDSLTFNLLTQVYKQVLIPSFLPLCIGFYSVNLVNEKDYLKSLSNVQLIVLFIYVLSLLSSELNYPLEAFPLALYHKASLINLLITDKKNLNKLLLIEMWQQAEIF